MTSTALRSRTKPTISFPSRLLSREACRLPRAPPGAPSASGRRGSVRGSRPRCGRSAPRHVAGAQADRGADLRHHQGWDAVPAILASAGLRPYAESGRWCDDVEHPADGRAEGLKPGSRSRGKRTAPPLTPSRRNRSAADLRARVLTRGNPYRIVAEIFNNWLPPWQPGCRDQSRTT
jgi:hypothetical protein